MENQLQFYPDDYFNIATITKELNLEPETTKELNLELNLETQLQTVIDISNINNQKKIQVKNLYKMMITAKAYSILHHKKAVFWWYIYWITGFITILSTAVIAIINVAFNYNSCNNNEENNNTKIKLVNVISTSLISAIIGIFTFMNPTQRRRDREDAGDRYIQLSNDIKKDTFLEDSIDNINTGRLLDIYNTRYNDYINNFYEPPREQLLKILEKLKKENDIILLI